MEPPVKIGDRVRITGVMQDPNPIGIGVEGTVRYVGGWANEWTRQIGVTWDDGSTLMLLEDDPFTVVHPRQVAS